MTLRVQPIALTRPLAPVIAAVRPAPAGAKRTPARLGWRRQALRAAPLPLRPAAIAPLHLVLNLAIGGTTRHFHHQVFRQELGWLPSPLQASGSPLASPGPLPETAAAPAARADQPARRWRLPVPAQSLPQPGRKTDQWQPADQRRLFRLDAAGSPAEPMPGKRRRQALPAAIRREPDPAARSGLAIAPRFFRSAAGQIAPPLAAAPPLQLALLSAPATRRVAAATGHGGADLVRPGMPGASANAPVRRRLALHPPAPDRAAARHGAAAGTASGAAPRTLAEMTWPASPSSMLNAPAAEPGFANPGFAAVPTVQAPVPAHPGPPPAAFVPAAPDTARLVDEVMSRLERKLRDERQRRGG